MVYRQEIADDVSRTSCSLSPLTLHFTLFGEKDLCWRGMGHSGQLSISYSYIYVYLVNLNRIYLIFVILHFLLTGVILIINGPISVFSNDLGLLLETLDSFSSCGHCIITNPHFLCYYNSELLISMCVWRLLYSLFSLALSAIKRP